MTIEIDKEVRKRLNEYRERYAFLKSQSLKLEKKDWKQALENSGAKEEDNSFDYVIGQVEYFPIFLRAGDELNFYAATNCHYVPLFSIRHMLPNVETFLDRLEEQIKKLYPFF